MNFIHSYIHTIQNILFSGNQFTIYIGNKFQTTQYASSDGHLLSFLNESGLQNK